MIAYNINQSQATSGLFNVSVSQPILNSRTPVSFTKSVFRYEMQWL